MIYADPSFLCSLYGCDSNTQVAAVTYSSDARRPLVFTPWQRFEVCNAFRVAAHTLRRTGQPIPWQRGNVFKRIEEDLSAGRLKHEEPNWRDAFRLVEELSDEHTEVIGSTAVDLWHVACAVLLRVDTFWTFDREQKALADAVGKFRRVPQL